MGKGGEVELRQKGSKNEWGRKRKRSRGKQRQPKNGTIAKKVKGTVLIIKTTRGKGAGAQRERKSEIQ